jgi:D-cysteine desulfhydrase family pyridoxal phosphate-dependent enzyme
MTDLRTSTESKVFSHAELQALIDSQPRLSLASLPTPLDFCPRLSKVLGGPDIFFKRDDLTGLAFGGNKTRQLEFLLPKVIHEDFDIIVAGAYTQSNWCRQITAAAKKLEIDVMLVMVHGEKGPVRQGNLLLNELMGAEIKIVDIPDIQELPTFIHKEAEKLKKKGRKPFIIDPFNQQVLAHSTLGYVDASIELDKQLQELNVQADAIYVAGANMTPAGLTLGMKLLGRKTRVIGISPVRWRKSRSEDIAGIANAAAKILDVSLIINPKDIVSSEDYIGPRYGVVTPQSREALKLVAKTEGIFLDPVYSSKAMAGLIDHIRKGKVHKDENVIFIHTGGNPALFAYASDLLEE